MTTAVVFVAGPVPPLEGASGALGGADDGLTLGDRFRNRIDVCAPELLVAADGGLDLARRLGYEPGFVVGDMDSVSASGIAEARSGSAVITELPRAKDASDYELAIDVALAAGAGHVMVIGGASGRLDHVFATVLTLTNNKYRNVIIEAWLVDNYVAIVHGAAVDGDAVHGAAVDGVAVGGGDAGASSTARAPRRAVVHGRPGEHLSLFSTSGPAEGVTTTGLRWVLENATLEPGTSLGISNELVANVATIQATAGVLAVIKTGGTK